MKRLLALVILVLMVLSLASCEVLEALDSMAGNPPPQNPPQTEEGGENGDGEGNGGENEGDGSSGDEVEDILPGTIFSSQVSVSIIKSRTDKTSNLDALKEKIFELSGRFAVGKTDDTSSSGSEIVVGATNRAISAEAKEILDRRFELLISNYESQGKYSALLNAYLIYAVGNQVAVVATDEAILNDAIAYFAEKHVTSSSLVFENGYTEFVPVDEYDSITEEEALAKEAAYAAAREKYGDDVVAAIEAHLGMFGEEFYLWLAGLYEKNATDLSGNVLGGAFYYSNSARDNDYYQASPWGSKYYLRPDLESTSQVLGFMQNSGMIDSIGGSLIKALPAEMRSQIVAFARALQSSEDGYFYHPQWGTSINTSRRSRDCSWGATILTRLGVKPYWNTPSGTSGMYGAPGSKSVVNLTSPLGQEVRSAAFRAVAVASVWTGSEQLATLSAWESYLADMTKNIATNSYSVGNTLSSQASQISEREELAIQNGELSDPDGDGIADGGYIRAIEKILNDKQKSNGLWEETVSENAVNGLMKICGIYSNLGLKFNNADKALEASLSMITTSTMPNTITTIYNAWVSTNSLLNNLAKNGDEQTSAALRAVIQENAYELITVTTAKVARFKKADGSFGYNSPDQDGGSSPYKSQGSIVSIRYTVEGDVNGGTIAYTGIWRNICDVLGLEIKPLGYADLVKFVDAIDYEIN